MKHFLLATVTVAFLTPGRADADAPQVILHKVAGEDETYGLLADYYYGARYLAHHLSATNRYREPFKRGATLIIPTYRRVTANAGESLRDFARRHLSNPSRAEYLKRLHGLSAPPKRRTRLIVPPVIRHRVRPGETLKAVANTYYRDSSPRRRDLIRLYNGLPNERVRARTIIRIPLDTPVFAHGRVLARSRRPLKRPERVAPPNVDARATATARRPARETSRETTKKARVRKPPVRSGTADAHPTLTMTWSNKIEQIERLYADGGYARALEHADEVLHARNQAPRRHRVQLLRLAAFALVALNRPNQAETRFRALLALDSDYAPDAYRTSPKILDTFEAARRPPGIGAPLKRETGP